MYGSQGAYGQQQGSGYGPQGYGAQSGGMSGYGSMGGRSFGQGSMQGRSQQRRGPRGWERSDERIKDDVCERIYNSDDFDASDVTVEVRSGVVTLDGTVSERRARYMLEDLAEATSGVKDVENRVRVSRESGGSLFGGSSGATGSTSASGAMSSGGGATSSSSQGSRTSGAPSGSSGYSGSSTAGAGSASGSSGTSGSRGKE
jgi:hypothetical protein